MQKVWFLNSVFSWIKEKPEPLTSTFFFIWQSFSIHLHTVWKNWDRYVQSISKKSVFVLITSKIGQVYMNTYKFKAKITVKCQFSVLGKSANNPGYVDISSRKLTWKEGAFCSATDFCHIKKDSIECRRNNIRSLQFVSLF